MGDGDTDARHRAFGHSFGQLLPRPPGVSASVQRRLSSAVVKPPRAAAERPHAGVEDARVRPVQCNVGTAGVFIPVENFLPGLAAVRCLEDAAFRVWAPGAAHGADVGGVRVVWVDHYPLYTFCAFEAEVGPGVTLVHRAVHAGPIGGAIARIALAGAEPDHTVVRGGDGDGAGRVDVFFDEQLVERDARVARAKDAPIGSAHVEDLRVTWDASNGAHAPAHIGRADRSPCEVGNRLGFGGLLLRRRVDTGCNAGDYHGDEERPNWATNGGRRHRQDSLK